VSRLSHEVLKSEFRSQEDQKKSKIDPGRDRRNPKTSWSLCLGGDDVAACEVFFDLP